MGRPVEDIPTRSAIADAAATAVWERGDPVPSMHVVADLYGVSTEKLEEATADIDAFVTKVKDICTWRGAHVLSHVHHVFPGVSGAFTLVLLLKESHVSLHAWPEFGFVAIDAFTCGVTADPGLICRDIAELVDTKECDIALMVRGPSDSQSMDVRNI